MKKFFFLMLGVLGGYVCTLLLSSGTTLLLRALWPAVASVNPPPLYTVLDILYSILYMVVGGFVAAWIARSIVPALVLGIVFLVLGIVSVVFGWDAVHPQWYQWLMALMALPAFWAGGRLRVGGQPAA